MDNPIRWLWPNVIPLGCLSLLTAPLAADAATLAAWLASKVLRGGQFPDGTGIEPDSRQEVMWVRSEERSRTVARFKLLDTPLDRLFEPRKPEEPEAFFDPSDPEWLELAAETAYEERPVWIVFEGITLSDLMSPSTSRFLDVIGETSCDLGCATTILCERDAEVVGSAAAKRWADVTGRMQTVLSLSAWAPDADDLCLRVTKTDGERPAPLRLRIRDGIPEPVATEPTVAKTARRCAAAFLEDHLVRGSLPANEVIELASSAGFSKRTIDRAKKLLPVGSFRVDGRWHWVLL